MAGPEAVSSRSSSDLQKTPPNSIEAEEALLGSALLSRDASSRLMEEIKSRKIDPVNNPIKQSPHTLKTVTSDDWDRPYSRQEAAFPLPGQEKYKFWPSVARINNAYGDRNLICSCPSVQDLENINSI